jgi:DNA helicase-2/ATP-dependent DNA helicase PcrA
MSSTNYLDSLNENQKLAVTTTEGPVLVLAGAGSGKTKALTCRIAYLLGERNINPYNILSITFTNKAAQEMTQRMAALLNSPTKLPWMGTFHSVAGKILRRELNNLPISYTSNFSIYGSDDQKQLVKKILKELQLDPKKYNPNAILASISGAKNQLLSPADYEPFAKGPIQEVVAKVYIRYQKRLVAANAMDFDDMLMVLVTLFQTYPQLLQKYQEQFKYILIDEYQDTNHAQYNLVKMLAAKYKNICVVGDDFQAIYGWRGADFKNILDFEKDYPGAVVVKLEQNYRSTESILNAAQAVIENNKTRSKKSLWTEKKSAVPVTVVETDSELEEAQFVAQEISSLLKYHPQLNDFACLYRTNAQSRAIEEALIKNNIAYRIVGGVRFYDRKEVKDIISYLRLMANENDEAALERIINVPTRGIGPKTLAQALDTKGKLALDVLPTKVADFFVLIDSLRKEVNNITPAQLVELVVKRTGYKAWILDGTIEGESRFENVKELQTVASQHETLEDFLESVALVQDQDQYNTDNNAVTLMTLHSAKGLEFPVVFLVGMEEGIFPHNRALVDQSELEEERRLCYVGITRAKDRLYMVSSRSRRLWGSVQVNMRSRFVDEIPDEYKESI